MKFGRRLKQEAYPLYLPHYIAYKELKKAINLITGIDTSQHTISEVTTNFGDTGAFTGSAYRPPEARFQDLLNYEVQKINSFATLIYTSTAASLQSSLQRIPEITDFEDFVKVLENAESTADGVCYLHEYVHFNLTGFRKITKKYDKHGSRNSSVWYMSRLVKEPFVNLDFDALIHLVALCFEKLFQCKQKLYAYHIPTSLLEEEYLTTTTYLISEEDLLQSRVYLAKIFPLKASGRQRIFCKNEFIKNEDHNQKTSSLAPTKLLVDDSSGTFSNPLIYSTKSERMSHGCLYFDNLESFQKYHQCLNANFWSDQIHQVSSATSTTLSCLRLRWPVEVPAETATHDAPHEKSQTPASSQDENGRHDAAPDVILEFIDPKCSSSDPHEWFDVPFSNSSPPFSNAVRISAQDVDAILTNRFDLNKWLQQQMQFNGFSESRLKEMKQTLTEALEHIHQHGNVPVWQMWLYRNSYRGTSFDVSIDPPSSKKSQATENSYYKGNYVNVYLDENVRFIPWKHDPQLTFAEQINDTNVLITANAKTSSFGMLSVSRSENKPSILKRLTGLTTVSEVWMYAPLLHGTSTLFIDKLPPRCFPHWYKFVSQTAEELKKSESDEKPPTPSGRAARVDVIPIRPHDRIAHDHVATAQQEGNSDDDEEEQDKDRKDEMRSSEKKNIVAQKDDRVKIFPSSLQEPLMREGSPRSYVVEFSENAISRQPSMLTTRCSGFFWKCLSLLRFWRNKPKISPATIRVEPKTFFANERTLLQWMNTAVLLSTISITLLNFGASVSRIAGFILSPVAIFFIIYPFYVYLSRSYSLERKEPINYNDRFGPTLLVVCLIGALSSIICLNIMYGGHP